MTKKGGSRARLQQDGQDAAGKEAKWAMVAAEGEESRLTAGDPPPQPVEQEELLSQPLLYRWDTEAKKGEGTCQSSHSQVSVRT